jgi:hypothetical protein
MAQIFMAGKVATVELKADEEGQVVATCVTHDPDGHPCSWVQTYDTWNDAAEYATDHADEGRVW